MTHRVLILGARGMLGHMVEHVLASEASFSVRGATRADFDVDTPNTLDPLLHATDYVINCIGVTARHIDDHDPRSVARA
ncbi:sugar nucleotide-binding protein, partial [Candidatus Uhrbacteria bacterium]|nr:sugar nucleotide-binding protein [Candidatus Uhrbacteria bacterium]